MRINIINPHAVNNYLMNAASYTNDKLDTEIYLWLTTALKKHILNSPDTAKPLQELPDDAPEWLVNKWDMFSDQKFHTFERNRLLDQKVGHIRDFLVAARKHDAKILNKRDPNGIPKFLYHLDLDKGYQAAEDFFATLSCEAELGEDDVQTVKKFENGYRVVELLTENALLYETSHMGHCIGKGAYEDKIKSDSFSYYSLYDHNDHPHATLEVHNDTKKLIQCFGKENKAPIEKYLPYIQSFLSEVEIAVDNAWVRNTGLILTNGRYHSIYELPENLTLESSLYLNPLKNLTSLPNGLTVKDDGIDLEGSTSFTSLGVNTTVEGTLNLKDCPIEVLPKGLKTELLYLHSPLIKKLPEDLTITRCADLSHCKNLEALPDSLTNLSTLYLDYCDKIKSLPKNIKVTQRLYLYDCKGLTHLPEDLELLQLDVRGCDSLKTLPKTLKAQEIIFGDNQKTASTEEARKFIEQSWQKRQKNLQKRSKKKPSL